MWLSATIPLCALHSACTLCTSLEHTPVVNKVCYHQQLQRSRIYYADQEIFKDLLIMFTSTHICILAVTAAVGCHCCTSSNASAPTIELAHILKGVPPQLMQLYTDAYTKGEFQCSATRGHHQHPNSNVLPIALLNDNYCDCGDGSDEPGSAACTGTTAEHNRQFYCHNLGHRGEMIPSSKVNDGICDCCDGTDEWLPVPGLPLVLCGDNCVAAAARSEETLLKMERDAGAVLRVQWEAAAATAKDVREERRVKVAQTIVDLESLKDEMMMEEERQKDKARKEEEVRRAAAEDESDGQEKSPNDISETTGPNDDKLFKILRQLSSRVRVAYETVVGLVGGTGKTKYKTSKDVERALVARRSELQTLDAEAALEYGSRGQFYQMKSLCVSEDVNMYTYKICFFKDATQKRMSQSFSLGRYMNLDEAAGIMRFGGGESCNGSVERSLTVKFVCSSTVEIEKIEEVEVCEYFAIVKTPAVCGEGSAATMAQENVTSEEL
eukprot:Lankesteria_metandrocarpae@DN2628_c0_g1_i1.p1